jgi:hypothetical protein
MPCVPVSHFVMLDFPSDFSYKSYDADLTQPTDVMRYCRHTETCCDAGFIEFLSCDVV